MMNFFLFWHGSRRGSTVCLAECAGHVPFDLVCLRANSRGQDPLRIDPRTALVKSVSRSLLCGRQLDWARLRAIGEASQLEVLGESYANRDLVLPLLVASLRVEPSPDSINGLSKVFG